MHRGNCCVPSRSYFIEPGEELQSIEARRAADLCPCSKRGKRGSDEPVDVEQGHDVEADIGRGERKRGPDVLGACKDIALKQRNDLGPRCSPGCVKYQSRV